MLQGHFFWPYLYTKARSNPFCLQQHIMKLRLFIILLALPLLVSAGPKPAGQKQFVALEDSLRKIGPAIFRGTDQDKIAANKNFCDLLKKALLTEGAFDYAFDSLKFIANLHSPDNAIRIFNWDMPKNDGSYMYYGFLVVDQSKTGVKIREQKDRYVVYDLVDKSAEIRNPDLSVLSPDKWYGALYYKIILTNDRNKKYYTVLGWDGNNNATWKKVIDVITFGKDGKPVFGEKNLFQRGKRSSKRVVFEFRAEVVMTLKYESDKNRIVFDHLAPEVSGAEGMYQFYSQTFVYDCFNWKKGKWQIQEDIDARNKKSKKDAEYTKPQGDQNPSGGNTTLVQPPKKHGKLYNLFHKKKPAH